MTIQSNRRSVKSVLINRPLQKEFTLAMIFIMAGAGVIVGLLIHFTLLRIIESSPNTVSRLALEAMLLDASSELVVGTILVLFSAVILTGFFGVFFLHRVAGPVYRFRQVLKEIANGGIPQDIKLRDKDFFKDTAEELNRMLRVLRRYDESAKQVEILLADDRFKQLPPDLTQKISETKGILSSLQTRTSSI